MTHKLDTATPAQAVAAAIRTLEDASTAVEEYVREALKGYPYTTCFVWRDSIELKGQGKVWRDERGHRIYRRVFCRYGEWQRLDELIAEAKAHYDSKRAAA